MAFHLYYAAGMSPSVRTVIRTSDTDVSVTFVCRVRQMEPKPRVWQDVGLSSGNKRRFICVTKLAKCDITEPLPGLHVFTGCDITAAIMNKGK